MEDQTNYFNWTNLIIAVLGALIAIVSIVLSIMTYRNSNSQFTIANQGYLQMEPRISGLTHPEVNVFASADIVADNQEFQGANFMASLTNIGNIPLQYEITDFDVLFNGTKVSGLKQTDNKKGILYPKQNLSFNIDTVPFNSDKSLVKFLDIKKIKITHVIKIRYNDLNVDHFKYVDREVEYFFFDNAISVNYKNFNDKI